MLNLLLPSLLLWVCVPIHSLSVTDLSTGDTLLYAPISPGDTLKTVYIHSLELTPVWEYFRIDAEYGIVLTDTLYESSGAGLPIPIAGQDSFTKEGDQFHIFDIQQRLPSIVLRVNAAYENRLIVNDTLTFNLSETPGDGVVRIHTDTASFAVFLFRYWRAKREKISQRGGGKRLMSPQERERSGSPAS